MRGDDYRFLATLLESESGLALPDGKAYLLEARLGPVARLHGMSGVEELVRRLRRFSSPAITADVVDAMTTNETLFFRDMAPFDALREHVLPTLAGGARQGGRRRIRVWSAACSTGQEPYSIAMTVDSAATALAGTPVEIVATDISARALARARDGLYSRFEVMRGLPVQMLVRNFVQEGDDWRVRDALRERVLFQDFNLMHDSASLGQFDIVFCRNVLIYFDASRKARVLESIAGRLREGGFLVLGCAETAMGQEALLSPVTGWRGLYRRTAVGLDASPPPRDFRPFGSAAA